MSSTRKYNIAAAVLATVFVIRLAALPPAAAAKADAPALFPTHISEIARQAKPAVVNIRTVKTIKGGSRVFRHFYGSPFGKDNPFEKFFGPFSENDPSRDFKQRSLGSGFIIDPDGHIVTNNHVIENADEITVRLSNEKEYKATVIGRDPKTDLALIKIDAADLSPLELGDSDNLDVGTWVVAIGSPFGLEQTVTAGIVSAKGRTIGSGPYDDFIQTDASINPGNSGGPLINMQGQVVGINTAILAQGQGIGFAIPVSLARDIIQQLKNDGEVTRGWLGVGIQDLTEEIADYYGIEDRKGALVTEVYEDDPADLAGIRKKDIITEVNGTPVTSSRELSKTVAGLPVGKRASIKLVRDGREKTVHVTLAKRSEDTLVAGHGATGSNGTLGLAVAPLSPDIARQFGFDTDEKGIIVTRVVSGSKAEQAGFKTGDLILEVNRRPVDSTRNFKQQIDRITSGQNVQVLVKRGRGGFAVLKFVK